MLISAAPALFAATRVEAVVARPTPAAFAEGTPRRVEIVVTIGRGQFDRQACDVIIETGDGGGAARLSFGPAEERTKSVRHTYQKPGSYQIKAIAGSGCTGNRSVSVTILAKPDAAPPPSSANAAAEPVAPTGPGCPAGWWLAPESVQGARYACRPNLPSKALICTGGTSYFSENGIIGCR